MKNNTYFLNMKQALTAYWNERKAAEKRKDDAVEKYGWDSPEYLEAYDAYHAMRNPYKDGTLKAYRAWQETVENEDETFVLTDFFWDNEIRDFVEALKAAGITEFIYTSQSTGLMDDLHGLTAEGCTLKEFCTITREGIFGSTKVIKGIRFALN